MSNRAEFLQKSEERFRFLVQNATDIIVILSVDGTLTYSSLSVKPILGYEPERWLGKSVMGMIHPHDAAIAKQLIQDALASPSINFTAELRLRHYDGTWRDFEIVINNHRSQRSIRGIVATCHEITERKRAAELLQRYQLLSASTNDIVLFIHRNGQILEANDAAVKAYGYTRDELVSLTIQDLRSPAAGTQVAKQVSQDRLGGLLFETVHCRRDGSLFPVEVSSKGALINQEPVTLNIIRDITQRKEAEDQLQQTQIFLQTMIDYLPVAVFAKDGQASHFGQYKLWNKASETIFGITAEQALGKSHYDFFPKNQADSFHQQDLRCFQRRTIEDIPEELVDSPSGTKVHHTVKVPIFDDDQQSQYLLCISEDITERKQAERQLKLLYEQVQELNARLEQEVRIRTAELERSLEFEALLKRITDKVRDSLDESQIIQTAVQELVLGLGVYSCDTGIYDLEQGVSLICNEVIQTVIPPAEGTVVRFLDYGDIYAQLLNGQHLQFCWKAPTQEPTRPNLKRLTVLACPLIDDQGVLGDLWLVKPEETHFDETEVRLVQQVANQCAIAIRQARLYQSAQLQVQELERLNQLKDDFLNTVSHELRTPMSNIKMATQMLEVALNCSEITSIPPNGLLSMQGVSESMLPVDNSQKSIPLTIQESSDISHYLQILNDECQREIDLINDLLDLSRLDSGTEPLVLSKIDPRYWVPSIAEPFLIRTNRQHQRLTIDISDSFSSLTTDLSILSRTLTELLGNACKYTPAEGEIRLTAQMSKQTCEVLERTVQICVTNTGVEIPPEEHDLIFEKFYRIPNNDPWKHGGTGLGLALVKRMVDHLGGTIHLESGNNRTTFIINLPLEYPQRSLL